MTIGEWIACSERMPEVGVGVLVSNGTIVTAAEWCPLKLPPGDARGDSIPWWDGHEHSAHDWDWHFDMNSITHWMPLPAPPTSGF